MVFASGLPAHKNKCTTDFVSNASYRWTKYFKRDKMNVFLYYIVNMWYIITVIRWVHHTRPVNP